MFEARRAEGRKALITFATAGDPDLETTARLVPAMEGAGADLVELGVPYSDPVAEGPVIAAANARALQGDVRLGTLFGMVRELRGRTQVPLAFLVYLNCILQYGKAAFFTACANSGVDGVIVPDLPYEESGEISREAAGAGVHLIRLVAPTSGERLPMIARAASGFLYCVSSLGVTGVRDAFNTDFERYFEAVNRERTTPTALGFGISTPEQVRALRGYADAVIVASAIVRRMAEAKGRDEALRSVVTFVRALRKALDSE